MPYEPYASVTYYKEVFHGESIPEDYIEKYLRQASRHIDSLTYNRIVSKGISNLTEFQQEIVREVCCEQAEFEFENREIFDAALQGYSINGVSMQFGSSWNVRVANGIPMKRDAFEKLSQTGLCCGLAGCVV